MKKNHLTGKDYERIEEEEKKEKEEEKNPIYISDRRWKKIIHILRTSAFINDRNKVDITDCSLIWNCLWSTQEEITLVKEWTELAIAKALVGQVNINVFIQKIENFRQLVQKHFIKTKILQAKRLLNIYKQVLIIP